MSLKKEITKRRNTKNKQDSSLSNVQNSTEKPVLQGIDNIIYDELHKSKGICLDLSRKTLTQVPSEILKYPGLKFLYLEGNDLEVLPEDIFDVLCNLEWLDLRNNKLKSLPETIGNHKHLKTLLLQGNNLSELPSTMGHISTLTGLSLAGNPLVYPTHDVIEQGTKAILQYLQIQIDSVGNKSTQSCGSQVFVYESESDGFSEDEFPDYENKVKIMSAPSQSVHNRQQKSLTQPPGSAPPSFYGTVLGGNPRSNVIKPWRTGVYFSKLDGSEKGSIVKSSSLY